MQERERERASEETRADANKLLVLFDLLISEVASRIYIELTEDEDNAAVKGSFADSQETGRDANDG